MEFTSWKGLRHDKGKKIINSKFKFSSVKYTMFLKRIYYKSFSIEVLYIYTVLVCLFVYQ